MKPIYLRPVYCEICGKSDTVSLNRPHSLHKTKRALRPNLQKHLGLLICQGCRRTLIKNKGGKKAAAVK